MINSQQYFNEQRLYLEKCEINLFSNYKKLGYKLIFQWKNDKNILGNLIAPQFLLQSICKVER